MSKSKNPKEGRKPVAGIEDLFEDLRKGLSDALGEASSYIAPADVKYTVEKQASLIGTVYKVTLETKEKGTKSFTINFDKNGFHIFFLEGDRDALPMAFVLDIVGKAFGKWLINPNTVEVK